MKHTTGEWKAENFNNADYMDIESVNGRICSVHLKSEVIPEEEAEANARIISAAPIMLQALLAIYSNDEANEALTDSQLQLLEAAIKKATE